MQGNRATKVVPLPSPKVGEYDCRAKARLRISSGRVEGGSVNPHLRQRRPGQLEEQRPKIADGAARAPPFTAR
jgi:hypothetical protein